MQSYSTIVSFFQQGGVFMYPIMLIFAVGIAISIERFVFLIKAKRNIAKAWVQLKPLLDAGSYQEAADIILNTNSAISQVLSHGISRVQSARALNEIETAVEQGLMEVVPRFEKRTHYLATFANVATLLGLLGTIIGLIQAFTAVSHAEAAQKADLLSSSISVAMNTTAFGLMAAIPLLLVYSFLQTRTSEMVDGLEAAGVNFISSASSYVNNG
ncbi:MAG: MotA/TolQ/ExbB proton channel family protein [Gammaproteobacteria bacterium]|nr:MotA/TolQ/ExbB proton channel family protein [Gammaproteobacteria bacterium]MDH5727486.1 MotA/TolQ/ExbB proton channel family protein [Gammaproteobacteria bacterium]